MPLRTGLALAALGYVISMTVNLDPGNHDVAAHLALATGGALLAAFAWTGPARLVPYGLAAWTLARAWSATRGTVLGNWGFAIPAWLIALGLGLACLAAWPLARDGALDAIGLRRGLALAALATAATVAWQLSVAAPLPGILGPVIVSAGLALAALDPAGAPAPPAGAEVR